MLKINNLRGNAHYKTDYIDVTLDYIAIRICTKETQFTKLSIIITQLKRTPLTPYLIIKNTIINDKLTSQKIKNKLKYLLTT